MNENLNNCTFTGYLVKDPKFQYTSSGVLIAKFAIRQSLSKKVGGEYQRETQYINGITAIGKTAERIKEKYAAGTEVTLNAEFQVRKYEHNGENRYAQEFFVRWINFPAPPSKFSNETEPAVGVYPTLPLDGDYEEIPF